MNPQNRSLLSPLDALVIPVGRGNNVISNDAPAVRYVAASIFDVIYEERVSCYPSEHFIRNASHGQP